MSYQLVGKIKEIGDIQQKTDSFKLRTFVVTIDGDTTYPQHVSLQAVNEKCDMLSTIAVGSEVTVSFNLRGREWTSPTDNTVKYFNTLDAWKVEAGVATPQSNGTPSAAPVNQTPVSVSPETEDDLPF